MYSSRAVRGMRLDPSMRIERDGTAGQQLVELAAGDSQGLGGLGHGQQETSHAAPPASGRDGGYSRPTKCQSVTTSVVSLAHVGQEPGGDGLFALVGGAVGTERAEGGGESAALGREVAGEAEHVRPGGQAQVFQTGELAEPDALGDVTAGVLADRQYVELVGG